LTKKIVLFHIAAIKAGLVHKQVTKYKVAYLHKTEPYIVKTKIGNLKPIQSQAR